MDNKLGTLGAAATVAGVAVAACTPVGATVLIAGGLAAGVRSVRGEPPIRYSGGGWHSGEEWLPAMQYILIWLGVAGIVFSVVLLGASLVCAPGCGIDMSSGLWLSLLLFVGGMISTGVGFVYPGKIATDDAEEWRPETAISPVTRSRTSLVRPANAVATTAKPLAVKPGTLVSDDNGMTWFVIIDNRAANAETADLVLMEKV